MATLASFAPAPARPAWEIARTTSGYDAGSEQWKEESVINDWAKPYVHADGSYKSYNELKSAGLWDPTNANLQRYFDALSNTGGSSMEKFGAVGDWRTSPGARNTLFSRLGLSTADVLRQPGVGFGDPREAFGDFFDSGSYGDVERARAQQVYTANKSSHGGLAGVLDTGGEFVEDVAPLVAAAAATYFGVNALGGLAGAAAPAVGPGASLGTAEGAVGTLLQGAPTAIGTMPPAITGMESMLGPTTGAVESAPVVGGASPTVSGVATGGSEFVAPAIADGGAMDMFGSASYPGGAAEGGMGPGSIFENAPTPNLLEQTLGLAPTGVGDYALPLGQLAGWFMEYLGSEKSADLQRELLNMAINSDQWRAEQPKYFQPLNDAVTKGIGDTNYGRSIADSTARKMASMGYNMSGNQMHEIAKGLHGGTMEYINQVRPLAMGRGESAAIPSMTPGISNAQQNQYGALGGLFNRVLTGGQPEDPRQPRNKGLLESIWSL